MAQVLSHANVVINSHMKEAHDVRPAVVTGPTSKIATVKAPTVVVSDKTIVPESARIVELKDYKRAAATLADAFADDHVAWYFLNTPDRKHKTKEQQWALHVKILEYITYAHCLKGLVVSAGPDHDCVALWMPPGENMDDIWTILRSGMWRLSYELSVEGRQRFFKEFLPLLNQTKAEVLGDKDDDSWYLLYIGTKPGSQGNGYARKVIDFVGVKADAERRICYLESSNPTNRVIYGKMGFELKKSISLDRDDKPIALDIMTRAPSQYSQKRDTLDSCR